MLNILSNCGETNDLTCGCVGEKNSQSFGPQRFTDFYPWAKFLFLQKLKSCIRPLQQTHTSRMSLYSHVNARLLFHELQSVHIINSAFADSWELVKPLMNPTRVLESENLVETLSSSSEQLPDDLKMKVIEVRSTRGYKKTRRASSWKFPLSEI